MAQNKAGFILAPRPRSSQEALPRALRRGAARAIARNAHFQQVRALAGLHGTAAQEPIASLSGIGASPLGKPP